MLVCNSAILINTLYLHIHPNLHKYFYFCNINKKIHQNNIKISIYIMLSTVFSRLLLRQKIKYFTFCKKDAGGLFILCFRKNGNKIIYLDNFWKVSTFIMHSNPPTKKPTNQPTIISCIYIENCLYIIKYQFNLAVIVHQFFFY